MKGKVRKSIDLSIKDGICWANMVGLVEPYIVPFALNLGASNLFIGVVRSIPSLISSFSQFFSEWLVWYYRSCQKIVYWSVFIQAFCIFISSFTILIDLWWSKYLFLFLVIGYSFSGSVATAPWFTLMGEYLPQNSRGKFFGKRTQIIGIFYFFSSFVAGYLLKVYNSNTKNILFILFLLASFFRFCSSYYINLMYEPDKKYFIPKEKPSFLSYFYNFKINPFVRKIYVAIFILLLSTYIAAPYFSVYILKELEFDYIKYMFLTSFGQVLTWFTARFWGKLVDKKGSVRTLKYAFISIPLISFMWIFTKNFYILLAIEIFSGFVWGAFAIVYNTFVYEYVKADERTKYTAYLIFIMSVAQFLGSFIGGILYDKIHFKNISTFILILAISTSGRFYALTYFLKNSHKE
ncbi:MAG: MFS transporter [Elusimicrobiota bacterium]